MKNMYKHTSQKNLKTSAPIHFIRNVISPNAKKSEASIKEHPSFTTKEHHKVPQGSTRFNQKQRQLLFHTQHPRNFQQASTKQSKENNINFYKRKQAPQAGMINNAKKNTSSKELRKMPSIRDQYESIKIVLIFDSFPQISQKGKLFSIRQTDLQFPFKQTASQNTKESFFFYFDGQTTVKQLLSFCFQKLQAKGIKVPQQLLYYQSGNMHIDFFLTLKNQKVSEIPFECLTMKVRRIAVNLVNKISLSSLEIIKCIGSGGFSKVFLARAYGILMALKVIPKEIVVDSGKQSIVHNQKYILEACKDHPFVTKLYLSLETNKYVIFGMEYCNGGELFNLLRKVKRMSQEQAKFYFLETLSVISFLHSKKIVYRDLKPENIILDNEGHIRLADYGLSKILQQRQKTYSFCGSAQYMAPEMLLKKGHSYEVDFYCLGALLYELITGLPPYYSRDQNELFNNIMNKDLSFPSEESTKISSDLKQFLIKLLSKNTNQRFKNINQMFSYKWFQSVNMNDILLKKLTPPFKTANFNYNFDDSQFSEDEEIEMKRLQIEKDNGEVRVCMFENFDYEGSEIVKVKEEIRKSQELNEMQYTRGFKKLQATHQSLIPQANHFFLKKNQSKQFMKIPLTSGRNANVNLKGEMEFKMHQSNSKIQDEKSFKLKKHSSPTQIQSKFFNNVSGKTAGTNTMIGKQSLNFLNTNSLLSSRGANQQKMTAANTLNFSSSMKNPKYFYQQSNLQAQQQNNNIYYSPKNDTQKYFMNAGKGRMSHTDLKIPFSSGMKVSFPNSPNGTSGMSSMNGNNGTNGANSPSGLNNINSPEFLKAKRQAQISSFTSQKKLQKNKQSPSIQAYGNHIRRLYTQKSKSNLFSNIQLSQTDINRQKTQENCQSKNDIKPIKHLSAEKSHEISYFSNRSKEKLIGNFRQPQQNQKTSQMKYANPNLPSQHHFGSWNGYRLSNQMIKSSLK